IEDDGTANATTGNVITSGSPDSEVDHDAVITVKDIKLSTETSATSVNADGETVIEGKYGSLTIKADGSYTYTLDNSRTETQALAKDQTTTEVFDVTIKDEHGATDTSKLTIDIKGTNDTPLLKANATGSVIEDTTDSETASGSITRDIHFTDVDTNDSSFTTTGIKFNSVEGTVGQEIKGEYGKFVIDENSNYSYSIDKGSDNAKVDSLKAGETVTDTFTATVSDDHGGTVDIPIVITVTGTNDAPIATDNSSQENDVKVVIEDDGTANATTGNVITSGTPDSDVDHNAVITVKDVKLSTATSATSVNADGETVISGKYGTLTIKADGSYTYTLDNSKPDTQALAQDKETTEVFDVTIKDELGATASSTLTIDIEGTNDQPQITGDDTKASIDENGEGLKGTIGTLSLKDIDTNDTVTLEVTDVEFSGDGSYTNGLLSTKEQLLNMLSLAQEGLSSTTTDGKIIWTFNSHGEEFNYLPADKELILKYTIKATDSSGADNNNDTETITIAIKGKDDTITGASADTNSGKEDSGEVTGNVFYNDTYDVFENAAPAKITEFKVNGDSNTYTAGNTINIANVGDITILEDGSYVFRPATNYSGNIPQITYTATVPTDNLGNTTNISSTLDIKIAPVAETVKGNGSGDPNGGPNTSLTINPDHKYDDSSNVAENNGKTENWYNLNPEGENSFNLKDGWNNPDGKDNNSAPGMTSSEDTYALLTPVLDGPAGDSAVGCKFSYSDGTQTYEYTYDGKTPIKIPAQYLNTVKILPSPYSSGKYEITVQAMTVDSDGSTTVTAVSGNAVLSNIIVAPVPDGVDTVAVKQAVGDEDTYIDLDIKPSSQDPSETFNVRISDIPDGATIRYGDKDNNIQYKFEKGSWVKTVTGEADQDGMVLEDGKIIINNFDTSKLSILPPQDSNVDFVLKVEAQSVESDGSVSAWTDTINLDVTVHSVADPVSIETTGEHVTYTELQAEEHGIKLSNLIIKGYDTTDGSEQVALTVTGLAPEFTLEGAAVEYKGGEGTGRTWLVTMDKNNISNTEAYIKTPNNFSGEIKFSAQETNTDTCTDGISDSNSCTSAITDVTITVTPTPEATVNMSAAAAEDELTKLSFAINHENGDNDETLSTIYIKASDANGGDGKNFEIVYSEDGKTSISLEEALTNGKIGEEEIDGVKYYKITADGKDVDNIYVKGDGNYSGKGEDNSFSFKYEITDEKYTGEVTHTESTPVTETTDGTYHVTFTPVTDATTMVKVPVIDGITDGGLTLEGTTVAVNSTQEGTDNNFSVKVTVNAPADTDGSEHLVSLIVDGVPDGVKVENATYLCDSEAEPGAGRWLITVSDKVFNSASSIEQTINFTVDRGNPNIWALNGQGAQKITITAVSQDRIDGMTGKETESSTSAEFDIKINFTGEGPGLTDIPAPDMTITANGGTVEDAESCTLADFFTAEYNGLSGAVYQNQTEFRFSITIKGFPDGATITGDAVQGKMVTIEDNGSVTISGFGDDAAIESILKNVEVHLPKDNNNTTACQPHGMLKDVPWKTEGWDLNKNDGSTPTLSGGSDDPIYANVTPVTDPMEITITSKNAAIKENQSGETAGIEFTIHVGDGGDGKYGQILNDGKLYVKLADGSGDEHGTVTCGGVTYTLTEVSDVKGIADGKYYVIENVTAGSSLNLTYTPDTFYSGNVTVTAQLASQETGAALEDIATSEGSLGLTVNPVNTVYNFEVNNASTKENGEAELTFARVGDFDLDGSEVVHCAYISGFDAAHGDDFIVKYTLDGVEMTASKVAAGVDGKGNTLYQWVISVGQDGHLPTDIRIVGLNHYSGTQHLTATVVTGETALGTGLSNSVDFDVTFEPTADGFTSFTPTLTFGNSGEYIDLNLNAMVTDTTANNTVETATVTLTGLGDGASFFIEDGGEYKAVTTTYDAVTDTYTISGIALDKINDVKILTPNTGSHNVTVDAWTVVEGRIDDKGTSAHNKNIEQFGKDFDIKVSEASPTEDGDRLIYNGSGSYDGKGGEDTLFMANFRSDSGKNNIDFSDKAVDIKNIEIIDMSDGGHTLTNLTAEAVKNITDSNNKLLIRGDAGDKIALSSGWTKGADTAEGYHVYTNNGATINVAIGNGIDTASLMMAMAFAPISNEAAVMPDS
ncbi:MAG: VCBS domain-containing protein, partial [Cloacibacillus porcorum]|uniref:VCBS domain-containing protein n=1 Tax=Cloacibacillus porcorum TaxID=1197717 RepID=UPI0023F2ECD3